MDLHSNMLPQREQVDSVEGKHRTGNLDRTDSSQLHQFTKKKSFSFSFKDRDVKKLAIKNTPSSVTDYLTCIMVFLSTN